MLELDRILTDQKYSMMFVMLARTIFDKYFTSFDMMRAECLAYVVERREIKLDNFNALVGIFLDKTPIAKLLKEIDQLEELFNMKPADCVEAIGDLLPPTSGLGSMPLIVPHVAISLVDLGYKLQQAFCLKWNLRQSDAQIASGTMRQTQKFLRIDHIENYDGLNLLHVNVLRAMVADSEDTVVQLCWIRLQHLMAVKDEHWKIDPLLADASPEQFKGAVKFLLQMSRQREQELRLSRQASFMDQSDYCRDVRIYFSDICNFTVEKLLQNLTSQRETVQDVIERNLAKEGSAREQAEKQYEAYAQVMKTFIQAACAKAVSFEKVIKRRMLMGVLCFNRLPERMIDQQYQQLQRDLQALAV